MHMPNNIRKQINDMHNQESFSDYYRNALEKIKLKILSETEATILGTDSDELCDYYIQDYILQPIEFDETRETNWDHQKYINTIPSHQREEFYRDGGDLTMECERVRVEIPISPNKNIDTIVRLQSSTFTFGSSVRIIFHNDKIAFSTETKGYHLSLDEASIAKNIENGINHARTVANQKNNDINQENDSLKSQVQNLIGERKRKLEEDKEKLKSLTSKINIPLRKKDDPTAKKIEINQKPIIKKIKPSPKLPEEYVLDDQKVLDIISYLDNQGKQFEKAPKSYEHLGEENLRDVLLINLNALFEGKATGETFSKKGKTDIYLNIDKGNILVFECKIWKGKDLYKDAIDQLRGYLTWRHNFGIVITFVRNKNFSNVLTESEKAIKESGSYINGFRKINDTHFTSKHSIEDDDEKTVDIHHLFYNIYA